MGSYGKQQENTSCPWEALENTKKTIVFRGNQWKTLRKHKLSVETNEKRNTRKTQVVRGNLWKTIRKHCVPWEPMENNMKTYVPVETYGKHKGNQCCPCEAVKKHMDNTRFPWEPIEKI